MVINDNQESREDLVGNQIFETANKLINYGILKNLGQLKFFSTLLNGPIITSKTI
jgi:hypothetical protein